MKRFIVFAAIASFLLLAGAVSASADEACFNPNTQFFDVNGVSKLNLWDIPGANGNAVWADAKESWHSELSVAMWYSTILKAQELNMVVVVGYSPTNYEMWYMAKPRATCP